MGKIGRMNITPKDICFKITEVQKVAKEGKHRGLKSGFY